MELLLLLALSVLPGIAWVSFFARHDRNREPPAMLMRTFVFGMVSVVPAALLERPLRSVVSGQGAAGIRMAGALMAIGLIEEGVKLSAAHLATVGSPHFDEFADGIVYAITAALGFAAVENLLYTMAFGLNVGIIRSTVTSLAHASFTGVPGLYLGLLRIGRTGVESLAASFLGAALLHALYDYLIISRAVSPAFAILLVFGLYRYVLGQLRSEA